MSKAPILSVRGLTRTYETALGGLTVLKGVDLDVFPGEIVGLIGPSGSGKSSLLHAAGLLERPTAGTVTIDGEAVGNLDERARTRLRLSRIGFVYQFHHLLPEFSALDNVAMPLIVRRENRDKAREAAREVLGLVGLAAREGHYPGQLSGGERQRVALARALVTRPVCVLADEPTGNLDRHTAHNMFELLTRVNRESGTAFAIVTHDPELAARADRQLLMENGKLVSG